MKKHFCSFTKVKLQSDQLVKKQSFKFNPNYCSFISSKTVIYKVDIMERPGNINLFLEMQRPKSSNVGESAKINK